MPVSVYPTGTTIYNREKCRNVFTIMELRNGESAALVDMNGSLIKR